MNTALSIEAEQELRQWCIDLCASPAPVPDGVEPPPHLSGYIRCYVGGSRSKRSLRGSGIKWEQGTDPRPVADRIIRLIENQRESGKCWLEAVVQGETGLHQSVTLPLEASEYEDEPTTALSGTESAASALARAMVDTNRDLRAVIQLYAMKTHELYEAGLDNTKLIGFHEGYSEAAGSENGQAMLASALSELTPAIAQAIPIFAQGYAAQSVANAQSAPSGHESQADEPAPPPTPEAAAMAHADRLEAEVESLVGLVMRSPGALTDAVRARLAGLLAQLEMARPFIAPEGA